MGHGKETPRQKMIGLMYLFLTCMLALNVSKEVLDAFILINGKLQTTNENFIGKNDIVYTALNKAKMANPVKAGPADSLAQVIRQKSNTLVDTMQYYKELIICTADGIDLKSLKKENGKRVMEFEVHGEPTIAPIEDHVSSKDNTDVPAQIMYGQENNGQGKDLRAIYEEFRTFITTQVYDSVLNETKVKGVLEALSTADQVHEGGRAPWESQNFEHLPLMAVVTNLTQMQTTIRNIEGDAISHLLSSIDAGSFKFNKLAPIVIPNSTYIMQGGEYQAQIFLGAFDTTQAPYVEVDGMKVDVDPKTNMAILKRKGNSIGEKKYKGVIKIKNPATEDTITYDFDANYQVAQSSVVVSPTKMNVFYVGVDNPVEISVPGIPGDDIIPSMSGGTIRKAGSNGYIVRCSKPGIAKITVSAKIDGNTKSMGTKEFRIKPVPDPVATVWDMEGGNIAASKLRAAKSVEAKMKNFDFDLKFEVTSYIASTKVGQYVIDEQVSGSRINTNVKSKIFAKLNKGQKVYFEEIKAVGPDKKPRKLGIIMFKVQ